MVIVLLLLLLLPDLSILERMLSQLSGPLGSIFEYSGMDTLAHSERRREHTPLPDYRRTCGGCFLLPSFPRLPSVHPRNETPIFPVHPHPRQSHRHPRCPKTLSMPLLESKIL